MVKRLLKVMKETILSMRNALAQMGSLGQMVQKRSCLKNCATMTRYQNSEPTALKV